MPYWRFSWSPFLMQTDGDTMGLVVTYFVISVIIGSPSVWMSIKGEIEILCNSCLRIAKSASFQVKTIIKSVNISPVCILHYTLYVNISPVCILHYTLYVNISPVCILHYTLYVNISPVCILHYTLYVNISPVCILHYTLYVNISPVCILHYTLYGHYLLVFTAELIIIYRS